MNWEPGAKSGLYSLLILHRSRTPGPLLSRFLDGPLKDVPEIVFAVRGAGKGTPHLDGSVSFRWSCRMAVCGSCGMNVDGKPTLTCKQAVDAYGDQVEVLQGLGERDRIVTSGQFLLDAEASLGSGLKQMTGADHNDTNGPSP